ncbi:hypothetical protein F4825DRAFT_69558 [Nemania diffusa]|nr:hypothetical protein F4825DRAFT_69558 [Nemania diffusa]
MKPTQLAIVASSLSTLCSAVPLGGTLRKLNAEMCARAAACGHHIDCTELWISCNLKLLLDGNHEFAEDGEHPTLGYMVPWWYQGMGMTM